MKPPPIVYVLVVVFIIVFMTLALRKRPPTVQDAPSTWPWSRLVIVGEKLALFTDVGMQTAEPRIGTITITRDVRFGVTYYVVTTCQNSIVVERFRRQVGHDYPNGISTTLEATPAGLSSVMSTAHLLKLPLRVTAYLEDELRALIDRQQSNA